MNEATGKERNREDDTLLATFGAARLIRRRNGALALVGGSLADRAAALDWCECCLPEAAFLCETTETTTQKPPSRRVEQSGPPRATPPSSVPPNFS